MDIKGKKILLVEDEVINALIVKQELENFGYSVDFVTKGEEAVQQVLNSNKSYDAVLMDIDLGTGIDGTQAAEQILKVREIPIVFLSSHIEPEIVQKTEKITSYGYVIKNSGFVVLDASIKMALRLYEQKYERKQTEKRLQELFEGSRDGLVIIDKFGSFLNANQAYCDMLGYSLEELKSMDDFYSITPEHWRDWEREEIVEKKLFKSGFSGVYEKEYIRKDGTVFPVALQSFTVFDADGSILYLWGVARDITEPKNKELALESERNRLAGILEGTRAGTWEWNVQTGEAVFNARWADIIGYTLNEISPVSIDTWIKFVHPDDLKKSNDLLQKHFSGELDYYACESRMRHKNGEWVWVLDRGKVISWTNDGKPLLMMGTHQDISEHKQAENALRESELFMRETQSIAKLGGWKTNPRTDSLIWNDGVYDIIEEQRDYRPGLTEGVKYYHPDYLPALQSGLENCLATGEPFTLEAEITTARGNDRWVEVRAFARTDSDGEPMVMGTIQDITDRKKVEEALRESKAKLSALFASMAEMVVLHELVYGEDGIPVNYRITDCNTAFTKITGIRHEDAVGRLANDVYSTPEPPYLEEFSRVAITGEPHHYETFFPPMNKHFSISVVSPGKDLFATITADISEAKRSQAIIAAKNKELEQIVYVASHDLRSPLVNVDGFSRELEISLNEIKAILDSEQKNEEMEKKLAVELQDMENSISRIRTSTRQMDELIKGLLKLSRFGRAALRITDIDMNELINQLAASFAFALQKTGTELTVGNLPRCRGDATQIKQVFSNLFDNAIKYRDPNRPGWINVQGKIEKGHAFYYVEDNGIGIAENLIEHIFKIFYRHDSVKTSGEGLGLTIARQSLSRMFGEIRVESKPGQGSVFIVMLPPVSQEK